jgi:signal transduction histidine kinase
MNLANVPIRRRLMIVILFTSVVVMILMRGTFFVYEYFAFRDSTVRQIATLGKITANNSTAALAFDNASDARDILSSLASEPHLVAACLYDKTGHLFAKYPDSLPAGDLPAAPASEGYQFGASYLSGFQPVVQGSNTFLGTLYIKFETKTIMSEWLWASAKLGLAVMALILAIAYFLSRLLERQISRPILELVQTAKAISERNDYTVRAKKLGEDELGVLTDAFNHMLAQIHGLNQDLERRVVERTAQLEAANKELEAFSYSVSHDLRAPLRHVDGFAGMLAKHAAATLDDKGRRYIATISGAARQMGRLIDDLLSFSRVGRSELNTSAIDHDAMVAAVIRDGQFEQSGKVITWRISSLPKGSGDPPMMRQVWSNLIENAVKYSGKAANPCIEIGGEIDAAHGENVYHVKDNGVGFDMNYVDKLFGVFQRLHSPADFEGTGIGLANVRRIIARHGGRTWAEGVKGAGATFYFSLPLEPVREKGNPREAQKPAQEPTS